MDIFYIIFNGLGTVVLLALYTVTLTILVSNENNLKWIPICSILSSTLTYICYLLLYDIFNTNKLLQISLGVLNCITAVCLLIGIFRRKRQGIVFPILGILGLVVFGGIPILSCSYPLAELK